MHGLGTLALGLLVVLFLLGLVVVGIAHIANPSWFMKRYYVGLRRGGALLKEWNELQLQIFGAILTCVAIWVLYSFFHRR